MKIVIDISERDYEFIKSVRSIMKNSDTFERLATDLFLSVKNGTPLPKRHGDLIDRDVAYDEFDKACFSYEGGLLNRIPAVIPADKEECNSGLDNGT